MIKFYLSMFLLCIFATAFTQTTVNKISGALETKMSSASSTDEILVWVYFTDKGNNTDVYFSEPQLVVSNKSIKRRGKVFNNSSPITMRDLPVSLDYISQVISRGLNVKWPSKWLNAVSGTISKARLNEIASMSFVKKLDIVYKLKKGNQPESDLNSTTQKLNTVQQPAGVNSYDYGDSYAQLQQINVPAVHDSGFTGQGVSICVMDAGFNRLSHDAFLSMNIIAAWDFVNNDPNVGNEGDLGEGSHGTMTLSTIGGFAPGYLIGPAFNSSYILAKTENTDSETPIEEDNWIAAMEWADSIGVDITSTSLSYLDYDPPYPSYTWMDMDGNTTVITNGADYAASIGIVVVNSAGNYGYNADHNTLGAPADGDSVITVGAVNSSGSRSSFSSIGPTVDGRIKPDVMALGSGDVVASPYNDHNYTTASGTSFSCPLSAGVAALILCANPNLTPMQVRDAMRNTASQNSNPDNLYGWGILNALDAINYFPPPDSTFDFFVSLQNGWNMVSQPGLHPSGTGIGNWWPGRDPASNAFGYNCGYMVITSADPAIGYYIKNIGNQLYTFTDIIKVTHDPVPCCGTWNIIGVYETPLDTADLIGITPPVYGYFVGYEIVDSLFPGYGYWVKCTGGQVIYPERLSRQREIVNNNYIKDDWGKINITDNTGKSYTLYAVNGEVDLNQFELPPKPPAGMFDIRFGSGRMAEDLNSSIQEIEMSGIEYPLTIRVENMDIRLKDETGKNINENIKDGEEIVIANALINKLSVSRELIPLEYSLEQNYPNPFNPSTNIKFSLPKQTLIKLNLYNILGELVSTISKGLYEVGYHQKTFNAENLPSGIYIYRLESNMLIQSRKMILLK